METGNPLAQPPEIFNWNPTEDIKRPMTDPTSDILLITGHLQYQPARFSQATQAFKDLVKEIYKTEPEFYGSTFAFDEAKGTVRIVELFESPHFFDEVHSKGEAIKAFLSQHGADGADLARLKIVGGFLGRN